MVYESKEQEQRIENKITFIGLYCKKCKGRERYLKNRQCYYCKQQTNKTQYEKGKEAESLSAAQVQGNPTGEVGGQSVEDNSK